MNLLSYLIIFNIASERLTVKGADAGIPRRIWAVSPLYRILKFLYNTMQRTQRMHPVRTCLCRAKRAAARGTLFRRAKGKELERMCAVFAADMKEQNRLQVYHAIRQTPGQAVTRTEIGRKTGISAPTVLKIFDFF